MFKFMITASLWLAVSVLGVAQTYNYESVPNDPMGTRIYTLKNGLKVYLSVNQDEPRITTKIAVRAGSKNDPSDCTGLAHYLEHMVFKGTSKIGTKDWNQESAMLKQISDLYETHKKTSDLELKRQIYTQIDSLSQIAASFAVPNEYDKMISSLGASGTNAYTSDERTVYVNEIPSNELEKWLKVERERFGELTLRLFHTELEAVYEEYNRMMDKDFSRAFLSFNELLFQKHPYGTQHTIGLGEHLKNPSMVKIHDYFNTYYVPNNIAIILVGDLDFDKTIALIDAQFGTMSSKPVPAFSFTPEDPILTPRMKKIYGPQSEAVIFGFRFDGVDSEDALYLELLDYMLNNSSAGLIDLNLVQKQKVLAAGCGSSIDKDYSVLYFYGIPKEGQTLDEVKNLILEQLENIKKGNFDPKLVQACKKNMKLDREKGLENNQWRSGLMIDAFIFDQSWKTVLDKPNKLDVITAENLMAFVNKHVSNNYVEVQKLIGKEEQNQKVEKPKITPLSITRDEQSSYAKAFFAMPSTNIDPVFVDYKKEIQEIQLSSGVSMRYIQNKTNQLFDLTLKLDMGTKSQKTLDLALTYLTYLGTHQYTSEDFKKALFNEGLELSYNASTEKTYIHLSGLQESFEIGLDLMENLFTQAKADTAIYEEMVNDILKSRKDAKKDKATILNSALKNYAMYGALSPFTDILTEQELRQIKPEDLVNMVKDLKNFKHRFTYYGPATVKSLQQQISKHHPIPASLKPYPAEKEYKYRDVKASDVFFVQYDMLQAEILFINRSTPFSLDLIPYSTLHNQYFGGGLSSIVFQEIRESKALAYAARNTFSVPTDPKEWCFSNTYIGTQADKLPDAIKAMNNLLSSMPKSEKQFEDAKNSALKQIATNRIVKAGILSSYESAQKMGIDYDYRQNSYNKLSTMTLNELDQFFKTYISNKPTSYLVIGKKESIDFEALKQLGPVKELSLEEIFGY